ncbi:hypothetical protein AXG93_3084s1010 [Marchantia polymorpha subsp. ruderalis]|uniref:CCHC-type domain-containing protein n=1 Tax=Marchantia polymorpha subsp. ruderalis TaxID=1480154 RepID=A0A176VQ47_MARPO|nr:hypothetical protein AXG93_3084s1010 [Marchantia polymorpha subsp. ruderalis]
MQRSQAEQQLCEVKTRLTEAEGKNRQLSEQTRDTLTARLERCLRRYVLWQIESHNGLRLRKIEHRAAQLIVQSGRRHRRLAKKLEAYLSRSRDAVANLELELVGVLKRLGLERKLEEAATANSADRRKGRGKGKKQEPLLLVTAPPQAKRPAISPSTHEAFVREKLASTPINSYLQPLKEAPALDVEAPSQIYTTPYFLLPGDSQRRGPPFPPNPGEGGGGPPDRLMANPQGNPHPPPFTKHSYPKFKGRGDDDDADSYIKLFESVSNTNKEENDADQMCIFSSLLRKKARSWYNHKSTLPTRIDTWAKLWENFLRRFHELGYDSHVLTKLRNLQRERKENLRDYTKRFQDLLDRIPKTREGVPYSTQQAIDSRRKRRPATPSSEESLSSEESSESEDSSSLDDEWHRKKATGKKKGKRMAMPPKSLNAILSKFDALLKDFADLKIHMIGGQDRRKSSSQLRAKLWCTTWMKIPTPNTCYNCGGMGHYSPQCPHPRRQMEYVPLCSNCRKPGHTAAECDQQPALRPTVGFVNPPSKDDVQVNQLTKSSEKVREDEAWPDDEVMVGKVETRSSARHKEAARESSKKDKRSDSRAAKEAKSNPKERRNRKLDPPVQKTRVSKEERESSERSGSNSDEFRDPNCPDGALITVPWKKVPHEGEMQSTSSGYTSAEYTTSIDEEDKEVNYMECYEIEEEGLVDTADDDWQLAMGLRRIEISHTEGVVDPSDYQDVKLRP